MLKSAVIVIVAVLVVSGQGATSGSNEDLINAALSRNWDELHRILAEQQRSKFPALSKSISSGEVRDLKPIPNGRFYAESEAAFHHAVNDNGKVDEQSGGHKTINDNGQVQEYDFKPQRRPSSGSNGVGAYSYQDASGQRYSGTYDLQHGQVVSSRGDPPPPFVASFQDFDDFFPDYFRNLDNLLQETFRDHLDAQQVALETAKKAFDITSNQAGYIPDFASRYPYPDFPGSGFDPSFGMPNFPFGGPLGMPYMPPMPNMPNMAEFMGPNSAFAGAAAGPGLTQHHISINPANPDVPNIDVTELKDTPKGGQSGGFYSVSSSAYSSSQNIDGKPVNVRGGKTVINDNGKVTVHELKS